MWRDWELNQQPSGAWDNTQPAELHWPGHNSRDLMGEGETKEAVYSGLEDLGEGIA